MEIIRNCYKQAHHGKEQIDKNKAHAWKVWTLGSWNVRLQNMKPTDFSAWKLTLCLQFWKEAGPRLD